MASGRVLAAFKADELSTPTYNYQPANRLLRYSLAPAVGPLVREVPMRFLFGLLAYVVGVSVVIGIGIVGLMALQSPAQQTPTTSMASTASNTERLVKPALRAQKKAPPDKKDKSVYVSHKPINPVPSTVEGGEAYGYAEEPRHRINPNFLFIFGR
jgi:hypothetical protein